METVLLLLAPWSPLFLPVLFPAFGGFLAGVLRQSRWPIVAKDITAWMCLVLSAILDIVASDKWSNNPSLLVPIISGVFTLLVAGAYAQLTPWLVGLAWVEKTLFNLPTSALPPTEPVTSTPPTASTMEDQITAPVVVPKLTLPTKTSYPEGL